MLEDLRVLHLDLKASKEKAVFCKQLGERDHSTLVVWGGILSIGASKYSPIVMDFLQGHTP